MDAALQGDIQKGVKLRKRMRTHSLAPQVNTRIQQGVQLKSAETPRSDSLANAAALFGEESGKVFLIGSRVRVRVFLHSSINLSQRSISVLLEENDSFADFLASVCRNVNRASVVVDPNFMMLSWAARGIERKLSEAPFHIIKEWGRDDSFRLTLLPTAEWKEVSKELKVFLGTWNVGSSAADSESLTSWLIPENASLSSKAFDDAPDICVFGLQEVDMSRDAVIFNDTSAGTKWMRQIEADLNSFSSAKYKMICSRQLGGSALIVYVKKIHAENVANVASDAVSVGIMGMAANKGGIGIRLDFYCSTICFITSHLAAHQDKVLRRNEDFAEIASGLQFPRSTGKDQMLSVYDHDVLFWMGDLNYRIDLPSEEIRAKIAQKEYSFLWNYDQLQREMRLGNCFNDFEEGPLSFAPTYKFDPGTDDYDTSKLQRAPAYTDRILWLRSPAVRQRWIAAHAEIKSSDHKPLSALFDVLMALKPSTTTTATAHTGVGVCPRCLKSNTAYRRNYHHWLCLTCMTQFDGPPPEILETGKVSAPPRTRARGQTHAQQEGADSAAAAPASPARSARATHETPTTPQPAALATSASAPATPTSAPALTPSSAPEESLSSRPNYAPPKPPSSSVSVRGSVDYRAVYPPEFPPQFPAPRRPHGPEENRSPDAEALLQPAPPPPPPPPPIFDPGEEDLPWRSSRRRATLPQANPR